MLITVTEKASFQIESFVFFGFTFSSGKVGTRAKNCSCPKKPVANKAIVL